MNVLRQTPKVWPFPKLAKNSGQRNPGPMNNVFQALAGQFPKSPDISGQYLFNT